MTLSFASYPPGSAAPVPPRERILAAARDLFYRHGIRAVGVDAIAEAAATNKMTLYRHFASKDLLVAEYLKGLAVESDMVWDRMLQSCCHDPESQLRAWLGRLAEFAAQPGCRGCALANAAVELPDPAHPARQVIEAQKCASLDKLAALFRAVGLTAPDQLADQVFLLMEGARINIQMVGPTGPGARLVGMVEALLAAHRP
jgi:AcrR family transcriptional regulator